VTQWRSPFSSLAPIGRTLTRLLRGADGSAVIEFAVVANALLLLLLGVVEFGRLYWTQSELQSAAEAAARAVTVYTVNNPSATPAAKQTAAQTQGAASAYSLSVPPTFVLTAYNASAIPPAPSCGNRVTVTYPFSFAVTGLFPFSITLTATGCHQG
jgi:Flp pilus assembly protein TadG